MDDLEAETARAFYVALMSCVEEVVSTRHQRVVAGRFGPMFLLQCLCGQIANSE